MGMAAPNCAPMVVVADGFAIDVVPERSSPLCQLLLQARRLHGRDRGAG